MFGHDDSNQQLPNDMAGFGVADAPTAPPAIPIDPTTYASPQPSSAPGGLTLPTVDPASATPQASAPVTGVGTNDDLLDIKQQALEELSPLVDHLDQTPEEKFRTTMMMIQASDNQTLIKDAYAAAKEIADEKLRAQALLDVINEINYFTQQHNS